MGKEKKTKYPFFQPSSIRLDKKGQKQLARLFKQHLQAHHDATVYLFGSRTRLEEKGGDLDLLIISQSALSQAYDLRKELSIAIKDRLGDQKVDIVIAPSQTSEQPAFVRLALLESVQIWP